MCWQTRGCLNRRVGPFHRQCLGLWQTALPDPAPSTTLPPPPCLLCLLGAVSRVQSRFSAFINTFREEPSDLEPKYTQLLREVGAGRSVCVGGGARGALGRGLGVCVWGGGGEARLVRVLVLLTLEPQNIQLLLRLLLLLLLLEHSGRAV